MPNPGKTPAKHCCSSSNGICLVSVPEICEKPQPYIVRPVATACVWFLGQISEKQTPVIYCCICSGLDKLGLYDLYYFWDSVHKRGLAPLQQTYKTISELHVISIPTLNDRIFYLKMYDNIFVHHFVKKISEKNLIFSLPFVEVLQNKLK